MIKLTSLSLIFLAAGIFTSVSILAGYEVLFAISLIYFSFIAIKERKINLPASSWCLIAFSIIALISLFHNLEHVPNPSKNFGRIKYFLYAVGGVFVFRTWLFEASDKTKKIIANVFLTGISVAGVYALWEFFISGERRVQSLTETMRYGYGSAMAMLLLLSAILQHQKTSKWLHIRFALVAFVLGFLGMYLTYTRGALLGFLCGLPFALYFYRPKLGLTLGGVAVLMVLGLIGVYLFGSGKYESRFLVNKNNSSDVIRRSQWQSALIAFQEKPVLGWGFSNFHSQLKRIKHEYNLDAKEYDDAHSHNLFLEIASGTGIIGFLAFLGWIVSWAIEAFKAKGLIRALVVPFGVAFVVSSQFEVTLNANISCMIFILYSLSTAGKNHV